MRRLPPTGAAVLAVLALGVVPAPTAAANVPSPASAVGRPVVAATLQQDADRATRDAIDLRRQARSLLTGYLTEYRDRFTAAELAELTALRDEADRELASLVRATRLLSTTVAGPASTTRSRAVARAAVVAHARARARAEASVERARVIVEPRLSVLELLGALRDYDRMMTSVDALGGRLQAIERRLR